MFLNHGIYQQDCYARTWWGRVDWGGLGMWNVRVGMIGCRPVEMWWRGWDVRVEGGRLRMNVWRMIWLNLVCTLNGQHSGICGEASYWEKRLTLAERGRNGCLKNKWWWGWDLTLHATIWCCTSLRCNHRYVLLNLDRAWNWSAYLLTRVFYSLFWRSILVLPVLESQVAATGSKDKNNICI